MTTLEPPANCVFFLSPNIYARARVTHISRRDFTKTIQLVDGLYDRLGEQVYPPGSYFTIQGDSMDHRVHSVIRNGDAFQALLFHDLYQRMNGMSGQKFIIALICVACIGVSTVAEPVTADDVDVLAQLVAKWAVEDGLVVASYQGIDFALRSP